LLPPLVSTSSVSRSLHTHVITLFTPRAGRSSIRPASVAVVVVPAAIGTAAVVVAPGKSNQIGADRVSDGKRADSASRRVDDEVGLASLGIPKKCAHPLSYDRS
jgi:hypothetical protein